MSQVDFKLFETISVYCLIHFKYYVIVLMTFFFESVPKMRIRLGQCRSNIKFLFSFLLIKRKLC